MSVTLKFCHQCGKPTHQAGGKFCPHCGTNLTSLASTPPPPEEVIPQQPQRFQPRVQPPTRRPMPSRPAMGSNDDDDDDDDPYANAESLGFSIDALQVEVSEVPKFKETVGGLISQGPVGDLGSRSVGKMTKKSQRDLIKQTLSEGGALRPNATQRKPAANE